MQNRVHGNNDLVGPYTFDDEAATAFSSAPITGVTVVSGSYRPGAALSAFDGTAVTGVWTITGTDHSNSDTGTIQNLTYTIACRPN